MKNLILLFSTLLYSAISFAQWSKIDIVLNNYSDLHFSDIKFINDSIGFITGGGLYSTNGDFYHALILKTTDYGENWKICQATDKGTSSPIRYDQIDFLTPNKGYVGIKGILVGDIYMTSDQGENWKEDTTISLKGSFIDLQFLNDTVGYIISHINYLYKTTNGGDSWVEKNIPILGGSYESMYFTNESTGFIVTFYNGFIHKTEDGGNNWDQKWSGNNGFPHFLLVYFSSAAKGFALTSTGRPLTSIDSGETWQEMSSAIFDQVHINSIFCPKTNLCYAVGGSGAIIKTIDGGANWEFQESGITNQLYAVHCTDDTTCYVVGSDGVFLKSATGGLNSIKDKENLEEVSVQVYPNPNNGLFKVVTDKPSNLTVYNCIGKLILDEEVSNQALIDLSAHSPGIYFLKVTTNGGMLTRKIIYQR